MSGAKKRYDSKYKVTRIWLADYQLLKQFSIAAGVSMAEALHELIIKEKPKAKPVAEPITEPVAESIQMTMPAFKVMAPVALRLRLQPTIATNGSKVAADRIKLGGIRYA